MMHLSTNDELEATDGSERVEVPSNTHPKTEAASDEGSRRGSSMFVGPDAIMRDLLRMAESQEGQNTGEILADFPTGDEPYTSHSNVKSGTASQVSSMEASADKSSGGLRRGSVVIRPMGGLGGFLDSEASDFDDSEEEENSHYDLPGNPMPSAPIPGGPSSASGGPNHRPMVGGFAAAAYEAARAYHYQNEEGKGKQVLPKRTGVPPSI